MLKEDDQLLRLKHDDAVLIYEPNLNEGYEKNPLDRLLAPRILEQIDDIPSDETNDLHLFLRKLAARYYQLLKDQFHEEKEVYIDRLLKQYLRNVESDRRRNLQFVSKRYFLYSSQSGKIFCLLKTSGLCVIRCSEHNFSVIFYADMITDLFFQRKLGPFWPKSAKFPKFTCKMMEN